MTEHEQIAEAMRKAGFNVIGIDGDDINVRSEDGIDEPLNFSVKKGYVIWHDFTHTTFIGPLSDETRLIETFEELLPLSGEDLDEWIKFRSVV